MRYYSFLFMIINRKKERKLGLQLRESLQAIKCLEIQDNDQQEKGAAENCSVVLINTDRAGLF